MNDSNYVGTSIVERPIEIWRYKIYEHGCTITQTKPTKGLEYFQNKCGPVAQVGGSTLVMQMCCSWN